MPAQLILQAVVRLVPAARPEAETGRPRYYRPLVVGPAILHRREGITGPWTVAVSQDGRLLPQVPASTAALDATIVQHRAAGTRCRIVTALVCPADVSSPSRYVAADFEAPACLRSEIYGWSLMYQPPGASGQAFVDSDEALPDLPACFELPLELMDRISFLESRGFRTRPLALITQPEDFEAVPGGVRNRFRPDARFGRPCSLGRLL